MVLLCEVYKAGIYIVYCKSQPKRFIVPRFFYFDSMFPYLIQVLAYYLSFKESRFKGNKHKAPRHAENITEWGAETKENKCVLGLNKKRPRRTTGDWMERLLMLWA